MFCKCCSPFGTRVVGITIMLYLRWQGSCLRPFPRYCLYRPPPHVVHCTVCCQSAMQQIEGNVRLASRQIITKKNSASFLLGIQSIWHRCCTALRAAMPHLAYQQSTGAPAAAAGLGRKHGVTKMTVGISSVCYFVPSHQVWKSSGHICRMQLSSEFDP